MMHRLLAHWNCHGSHELLLQSASSDPSMQSLSPSHFQAAGKQYRFDPQLNSPAVVETKRFTFIFFAQIVKRENTYVGK